MHWKQPIPTSITKLDAISEIVLTHILLRVQNQDMVMPYEFWNGNHRTLLKLKKGQCLFNVSRFCTETGISRHRISSTLEILKNVSIDENLQINIEINRQSFGLIITVLNADSLLTFGNQYENQSEINLKSIANQSEINLKSNNKSVKNDKKEKIEKECKTSCMEVLENYNLVFGKKVKSSITWEDNFTFWSTIYSLEEITSAVNNMKNPKWWASKNEPTLDLLFRRKNKSGNCDYISELLNLPSSLQPKLTPSKLESSQDLMYS